MPALDKKIFILGLPYLAISHHGKICLETVWRPIYSIVRQSILIWLDWLLCALPGSSGVSEAAVSGIVFVLLWRSERVEVSLHVALRLRVEFRLKGRKLLSHAEETSDFYAKNHPDYICRKKEYVFRMMLYNSALCCYKLHVSVFFLLGDEKVKKQLNKNSTCSETSPKNDAVFPTSVE